MQVGGRGGGGDGGVGGAASVVLLFTSQRCFDGITSIAAFSILQLFDSPLSSGSPGMLCTLCGKRNPACSTVSSSDDHRLWNISFPSHSHDLIDLILVVGKFAR